MLRELKCRTKKRTIRKVDKAINKKFSAMFVNAKIT